MKSEIKKGSKAVHDFQNVVLCFILRQAFWAHLSRVTLPNLKCLFTLDRTTKNESSRKEKKGNRENENTQNRTKHGYWWSQKKHTGIDVMLTCIAGTSP
jgi:alkaline phosphatase